MWCLRFPWPDLVPSLNEAPAYQQGQGMNYYLGRSSLMTERILVTNGSEICSTSCVERMCSTVLIISSFSSSSCKTDSHPGTTEPHSNTLVICASQSKWRRHPVFGMFDALVPTAFDLSALAGAVIAAMR